MTHWRLPNKSMSELPGQSGNALPLSFGSCLVIGAARRVYGNQDTFASVLIQALQEKVALFLAHVRLQHAKLPKHECVPWSGVRG